jgi:rhodanese-related sulfurtransferase
VQKLAGAVVLALVLALAPATPRAQDTPATLAGVTVLSAEQAKALIDAGRVRVFDLRKKASFAEGHLPSAASAAAGYAEAENRLDTRILGAERGVPVLFYSHGADGWKSYWAAKNAVEAGFTAVYWMRGGMAEWDARRLPIER